MDGSDKYPDGLCFYECSKPFGEIQSVLKSLNCKFQCPTLL